MPFFHYKVKNEFGETIKGKVEANNESHASSILRNRSLFVIYVKPIGEESFTALLNAISGIKLNDIVNFTRQLATMITAGLPLTEALSILNQESRPVMSKMIDNLIREIEGGNTFADALQKQDGTFSKVYIQLVKAGEAGGVLDEVLQRLADNLEKSKEFRSKTQGALIYPAIVVVAMMAVVSVLMIFVVPKLTEMYSDFGADLPFATQLLMDISSFFVNFWWLMLLCIFGAISFIRSWGKTKTGRYKIDRFLLDLPLFGTLKKKIVLTEFARTLSLLLSAGISLLDSLRIVNDAIENVVYNDAFNEAAQQVEKGVSLAQAVGSYDIIPPILSQMIAVGEQTGKLDEVLLKLSTYFQSESEQAVKNLTTAIEPLLMVVLGIGVAIIMIAVIMPIYNLTSQF